jgi:hypothetical protein
MEKYKTHFMGEITSHVAQTVNTEQLQHGLFQVHNGTTPHKGESKNDDDDDDNNNNNDDNKCTNLSKVQQYF